MPELAASQTLPYQRVVEGLAVFNSAPIRWVVVHYRGLPSRDDEGGRAERGEDGYWFPLRATLGADRLTLADDDRHPRTYPLANIERIDIEYTVPGASRAAGAVLTTLGNIVTLMGLAMEGVGASYYAIGRGGSHGPGDLLMGFGVLPLLVGAALLIPGTVVLLRQDDPPRVVGRAAPGLDLTGGGPRLRF